MTSRYLMKLTKTTLEIGPYPVLLFYSGSFTEGDGCFTVAKRGDISFIITQSTSDILILHYIQNVLGFGSVIVQSKDNFTHRYVVQDKLGL